MCESNVVPIFKKIISCWRSIEELSAPTINEQPRDSTIIDIVKTGIDDRSIPWINQQNQLDNTNECIDYYTVFVGIIPIDTILDKIKTLFSISKYEYNENYSAQSRSCLASFILELIAS